MTVFVDLPQEVAEGFVADSFTAHNGTRVTEGVDTQQLRIVQFFSDELIDFQESFTLSGFEEELFRRTAIAVGRTLDSKIMDDDDFADWGDVLFTVGTARMAKTKDVTDLNVGDFNLPNDMTAVVIDIELGYAFVQMATWEN